MFFAIGTHIFCIFLYALTHYALYGVPLRKCLVQYGVSAFLVVLGYFLIGFDLMYSGEGYSVFGLIRDLVSESNKSYEALDGLPVFMNPIMDAVHQLQFVMHSALLMTLLLGERIRMGWSWGLVSLLSTVVYPLLGLTHWGGGFLNAMGFSDFSGGYQIYLLAIAISAGGLIVFRDTADLLRPKVTLIVVYLWILQVAIFFFLEVIYIAFNGASELLGVFSEGNSYVYDMALQYMNSWISIFFTIIASIIGLKLGLPKSLPLALYLGQFCWRGVIGGVDTMVHIAAAVLPFIILGIIVKLKPKSFLQTMIVVGGVSALLGVVFSVYMNAEVKLFSQLLGLVLFSVTGLVLGYVFALIAQRFSGKKEENI